MLFLKSMSTLLVLFGLVFAVGVAALYALEAPLWLAIVFAVGVALIQYAISPFILQWILKINWVPLEQVDAKQAAWLAEACRRCRVANPRFGIIEDANPNAFTFGHYPGNARLVVTRGLLDVCDEREVRAVIAHELGHIVHWDFVVMTIAATVPLILYMIYRFGIRAGRGSRKGGGGVVLVAIGAFVAYIISEYIVLGLSRLREYYADEFSAQSTGDANALATGLLKVAYGLARAAKTQQNEQGEREQVSMVAAGGSQMLGIFDPKFGASMALASAGGYAASSEKYAPEVAANAMRWDIFNPWAIICELGSSHPLPAKRIRALGKLAVKQGQRPALEIPDKAPESYWDDFVTDALMSYAPLIGAVAGIVVAAVLGITIDAWLAFVGAALAGLGVGSLMKLGFSYPLGRFAQQRVSQLVQEVKVSRVRCIPSMLRGRIIGRGIPGLYWSEDLVIQDQTGFMTMDYRQPIAALDFLFGLFRAEQFVGQDVRVEGWYRRFPIPYLEIYKVYMPNGDVHTSHNRGVAKFLAAAAVVVGVLTFLYGPLVVAGVG